MSEETKKLFIGSILAIGMGLLFRIPSDIQDGLSLRNVGVGWYSWHLFGWLPRDVVQAIWTLYASFKTTAKLKIIGKDAVMYAAFNFVVSAVLSFFLHDFLYTWTSTHLEYFYW